MHSGVSYERIAQALRSPCTGADIGAVSGQAYSIAVERSLRLLTRDAIAHYRNAPGGSDRKDNVGVAEDRTEIALDYDTSCQGEGKGLEDVDAIDPEFVDGLEEGDARLIVTVTEDDLVQAAKEMRPSLSPAELRHYDALAQMSNTT